MAKKEYTKKCARCGKEFTTYMSIQKYCGEQCAYVTHLERLEKRREKNKPKKIKSKKEKYSYNKLCEKLGYRNDLMGRECCSKSLVLNNRDD